MRGGHVGGVLKEFDHAPQADLRRLLVPPYPTSVLEVAQQVHSTLGLPRRSMIQSVSTGDGVLSHRPVKSHASHSDRERAAPHRPARQI
eukprot:1494803-Rhodomonas_salina.2